MVEMVSKKYNVEVNGKGKGGVSVRVTTELDNIGDIAKTVEELTTAISRGGVQPIPDAAMAQDQTVISVVPVVDIEGEMLEQPVLQHAPHEYKVADAVIEILDPESSKWAKAPRSRKEVQDKLISMGMRGVTNVQNFDAVMRRLLGQGRLRRELIDGVNRYYYVKKAE